MKEDLKFYQSPKLLNTQIAEMMEKNKPLDSETKEKVKEFIRQQDIYAMHLENKLTLAKYTLRSNIGKELTRRGFNNEKFDIDLKDMIEIIAKCEQEIIDMIIK